MLNSGMGASLQTLLVITTTIALLVYSYMAYKRRLGSERQALEEASESHLRAVSAVAQGIQLRDGVPASHSGRAEAYAEGIAVALGLSGQDVERIRAAAILRDVGLGSVPREVLRKPSELTPSERDRLSVHPGVGAQMLGGGPIADIVARHHERWDGTGYPGKISGAAIPIGARIVAIADALDALTSDRPHRPALPLDRAIELVAQESGRAFDPRLVEIVQRDYKTWEEDLSASDRGNPLPSGALAAIQEARRETEAWNGLSGELDAALTFGEILQALKSRLPALTPVDEVLLWRPSDGEESQGFQSRVWASGEPAAWQGAVALRIQGKFAPVGILTMRSDASDLASRIPMLEQVAAKVGAVLDNTARFEQAEREAHLDSLTNIPNARGLFLRLDAELARARRGNASLAIVVADLDGFKDINDRLGHLAGNRLLSAIADALKATCREYDYVARLAGDEFVVLLPGADAEGAAKRAEHFRAAIARTGASVCPEIPVTASLGVAHCPEDGADAERLLAKADRQMYAEKRTRKHSRPYLASRAWNPTWKTAS